LPRCQMLGTEDLLDSDVGCQQLFEGEGAAMGSR